MAKLPSLFLAYLPFFPIQFDVTSCQGVLFTFCMVMMVSGLVLAIALPYGYVSYNNNTLYL